VFAAYVSRPSGRFAACPSGGSLHDGHAFIDRALYLPKAWTDDKARLAAAHVPKEVGFATKPRLAVQMIGRAIAANVPFAPSVALRLASSETDRLWRWWRPAPSTA